MTEDDVKVVDNPAEGQFEIYVGSTRAGLVAYTRGPQRITFIHTEIGPEWGGRGLGGRLVSQALDAARERGLAVVPVCPFVKRYIEQHPDYADLIAA